MNNHNVIYTTRPSMPDYEEYIEQIKPIWESRWLTNMGKQHDEFERELGEKLGVENIMLFVNGHMALEMVLQAMHLSGEVITTPFTFVSTTHAIYRNGLTPVFCDINETDYTIDVSKIEELITEKTTAIVPVHVYGNICDVEKIEEIARKHHLKVIYDAAHAFGVNYKGRSISSYGDASMFSFHATKVFNSIEGGAVVYQDAEIGHRMYNLKNFGIQSEEEIESVGANAKMNEFQAAMGICNLRHIDENIQKRKEIVDYYRECLADCRGIRLNEEQDDVESNYAYMPVLFDETIYPITRNEIYERLKSNNIYARKYFYPITNELQCYKETVNCGYTPIAKKISERVLTLPLYADMSKDDVERVCRVIKDV